VENGVEAVRGRLRRLSKENIELRDHVLLRLSQRCVRVDELVDNLLNPRNLYKAEKQVNKYSYEEKYRLYFKLSNRFNLGVVVVFTNNHADVITTFEVNCKIQDNVRVLKWRPKRR
jgi:hypothetical protein